MSVFDEVKKAIEAVLAPDIQKIKGDIEVTNERINSTNDRIKNLEDKIDLRFIALNYRFDDLIERLELKKRVEQLERERDERRAS
jgi:hypothetical protein